MKENPKDKKPFSKNPILVFVVFALIAMVIFRFFSPSDGLLNEKMSAITSKKEISYYELKQLIQNKEVSAVSIGQTMVRAISGDERTLYIAKKVNDPSLVKLLDENKIQYSGFSEDNLFMEVLSWILPVLIFIGFWMFMANRVQKNMGNGIFGMGSAKKLVNAEKPNVKFDDMAGNDEAKEEVVEIVDFLKYPDRYTLLGAKIPRGVLLVGPPGTGKTLLAKAVAGEANVPFFSMSGSSFIEMFVGLGASRVRDLFEMAKKEAPSIIFIDEIDAIGKSRAAGGIVSGNDEREQTLNQLLAEMDGFGSEAAPVIVLAATNRPEILDPALLRPGRFDRQVLVDKPDYKGRLDILRVHIKAIKPSRDVDLQEIAKMTAGLAGADLANIINEAALLAGRANKKEVTQADLKEAVERGIAGLEKKSRRISKKEKHIVAYHESGHALISELTKGADRVNKVSIIPRGMAALGYTLNTPQENKYLVQKHELIADVDVLLGGRAAEDVFLGEISTGASNDLERATDILKAMASYYGMTEVSGLMVLEKPRNSFLNGGMGGNAEYSEKTAEKLDSFIQKTLSERFESVKQTLRDYSEAIETMVQELLEKEVIDGERVRTIIKEYEEKKGLPSRLAIHEEEK
ncbi:ATP-dependent zinc metalloprotease FtsH [Helicobacter kayseriensis]|uniref:ATP-dependent zinc metalloprotease FtsH n=1 Tax=Helicobacter kayseriensis TaxID=2905877 RepID=UPI001E5C4AA9|nr:ATP-dependent zinc metalloprotease FtsH [Helicobacter kayseriensis]MCE3047175.1 ATP-dependent zinc metalloprotease FtsH [Helicobacter kayseriensis]MCE3048546.1 ATP-dependent zinc metalloprotease FtsH [Helicobacter kayseriensis]